MKSFDPTQTVVATRRNLPHWTQNRVTYFATFRLADAIPAPKLRQWMESRDCWLSAHPKPWTLAQAAEYRQRFSRSFHDLLDAGSGSCVLKDASNSELVAGALQFFEGKRYRLGEWVVMPNHVHVVFETLPSFKPKEILHSWKSYTANQLHQRLQRKGAFWQEESYDRIVRSAPELARINGYIRANPEKARLQVSHASWLIP